MTGPRLEGESFGSYCWRRKVDKMNEKMHERGVVAFQSVMITKGADGKMYRTTSTYVKPPDGRREGMENV